jgi:hypothetical protein
MGHSLALALQQASMSSEPQCAPAGKGVAQTQEPERAAAIGWAAVGAGTT